MRAEGNSSSINHRRGVRAGLLVAALTTLLLVSAPSALAAPLTVTLAGAGTGKVTSADGKINCSNVSGEEATACAAQYVLAKAKLTAEPSPDSLFIGWSGTGSAGTCGSGSANPCETALITALPVSVSAIFIPPPDPPAAATGTTAPGERPYLRALHGTVNPNEFAVSDCYFEYGPTTAYGTSVPCTPGGSELGEGEEPTAVSAETEPLEPETAYHYRLVAANLGGTGVGDDRTFTAGSPLPPSGCPNEAIRSAQGIGVLLLPDCMALELVTPPQKDSQLARFPTLSSSGERVQYLSLAALAETPGSLSSTLGDAYIATRGASGWATTYTAPPAGIVNGNPQSFTPELSCWQLRGSTQQQIQQGIAQIFEGCLGGAFGALSPPLAPTAGGTEETVTRAGLKGASADISHVYFIAGEADTAYLNNDPAPAGSSDRNTYVAHLDPDGNPDLELATRDSDGKIWGGRCGSNVGGTEQAKVTGRNLGAVSADGSLSYISTRPGQPEGDVCRPGDRKLRILRRSEAVVGGETQVEIEELFASECDRVSPACSTADGDDFYESASVDQSKVYFTTNRQLADSDLDGDGTQCSTTTAVEGCDLYLYDADRPAGERLIQVSAGGPGDPDPGEGAKVLKGITGISTDGSRAYFVARGVLTTDPNPEGEEAEAGQANLYLYEAESGETSFIGILDPDDEIGLWGRAGAFVNNAYPVPSTDGSAANPGGGDGHVLAFIAKASLTSDDADGGRRDVYRYDSEAETLQCVSCVGAADAEPFEVSSRDQGERVANADSGADFAQRGRWASDDGGSVVFKTAQGLLPGDANGVNDSYLWQEGQLRRLPGTGDPTGKLIDSPTVSGDGSTVAFQSFAQLLPFDRDTAIDIYVARVGGGFAVPEPIPPICGDEEGCQGEPTGNSTGADAPSRGTFGIFSPPPNCTTTARRAQKLSRQAKRLRRQARRIDSARRSKRLRRQSRSLARKARGLSKNAKRCRRANRRAGK